MEGSGVVSDLRVGAVGGVGFLRLPGNKIPADPHNLHNVVAADALEVGDVDLRVDRDDGSEAEVEVQAVVQLGRAGCVAILEPLALSFLASASANACAVISLMS